MRASGLADLLPSLENLTYVGVSAGSIAMTLYNCDAESNRHIVPPGVGISLENDRALGFVDCATWVHVDNPNPIFADHNLPNIEKWAAGVPVPTYALDDQSAIRVSGDVIDVVSEGNWTLFTPTRESIDRFPPH
jgi:dipeptidase E